METALNISRREFLTIINLTGFCAAVSTSAGESQNDNMTDIISFGVVADLHYADKDMRNSRYYRDSFEKLAECIDRFNELKPAFIIELGDFIDVSEKEIEIGYLKRINSVFSRFNGDRYYVLGNHDMATLSKNEFLSISGAAGNYYSFDYGSFHFIVLDANYNEDGSDYNAGNFVWTETYIHLTQQEWLKNDLEKAGEKKVFVFIHQTLDDNPEDERNLHRVKNAPEIRSILEESGNVRAVLQGHKHSGGFSMMNGIPYVTFKGAVEGPGLENNKYALAEIFNESVTINGFGKQESFEL